EAAGPIPVSAQPILAPSLDSTTEATSARVLMPPDLNLGTLVNWASGRTSEKEQALAALQIAAQIVPEPSTLTLGRIQNAIWGYIDLQNRLLEGFRANFAVEPVGYLHLERMTFTPAGILRGELLHSLALAPGEEVNISHRDWSNTSQEFERIVTDFLE